VLFSNYFPKIGLSHFTRRAVLFFSVFLISVFAWRSINYISAAKADYDSGVFVSSGYFLLEGKVLYKDFWDHKPPMVHFLNAAALSLGGRSINSVRMMERYFAVFGGAAFFFVVYLLFKNMWLSFFSSIFYLMHFFRPSVLEGGNLAEEYGAVFVMGGILFAILSNETKRFSLPANFISGMFFAAAFFTKEPFLFSAIPWFVYLILYKDFDYINILKRASVFISGAVLIFAVILFYLINNDALRDWIDVLSFDRVYASIFSRKLTMAARVLKNCKLAYKKLFGATFIAGLFALVGFISVFHWPLVKKHKYLHLVIISFFVMNFYATMISSKGYGHYYLQLVASFILLGTVGVESFLDAFKESRLTKTGFIVAIIVLSLSVDKQTYMEYKKYLMTPAKKVTPDSIVEYIKANSSKYETIWMTTGTFSRYYMESERLSPTKYFYITDHFFVDTYLSTAKEKVKGIMADLRRNPPKFIIGGIDDVKTVKRAKIQKWINENYDKVPVPDDSPAILFTLKSPPATLPKGQ
jgi:4-amino-4-deoxy-L-arabinose transferase-like glycosyltransferase